MSAAVRDWVSGRAAWVDAVDIGVALAWGVGASWVALHSLGAQRVTTIWLPAILVGLLVVLPVRRWWPYLLGLAGSRAFIAVALDLSAARLGAAFVRDLIVVVAAAVLLRRVRCYPPGTIADAGRFVGLAVALGATRSLLELATTLIAPSQKLSGAAVVVANGLSTAVGLLTLAAAMVAGLGQADTPHPRGASRTQVAACLAGVAALAVFTVSMDPGALLGGAVFVLIPVVVLVPLWFPPVVTASAAGLVAAIVSAWGTVGLGPLRTPGGLSTPLGSALATQFFLLAMSATVWLLSGTVAERQRVRNDLTEQVRLKSRLAEELAAEQARSQELADRDQATGLHTRSFITGKLTDLTRAAGQQVAVFFVDLVPFDPVRRNLGYAAGDELVTSIGREVAMVLPSSAVLGRFDGDRLVIVLPDPQGEAEVQSLAGQVLSVLRRAREVRGHLFAREGSVGVTVWAGRGDPETILRDADLALAAAAAEHTPGWRIFRATDPGSSNPLAIEDEIRRGLGAGEFVAFYQPQVRLTDSQVIGYEALARWRRPDRRDVGPDSFIGPAEQANLIGALGAAVLDAACQTLALHPGCPSMSVNVSPKQLIIDGWAESVLATLTRHGVAPDRLTLELTETATLLLTPTARKAIGQVSAAGIGLHVDDFGTGFSSISHLRDLPITGLKLDRSFVTGLAASGATTAPLVRGLAGLARGLGLQTIAEGVETTEQAAQLAEMGWDLAQGYLFSPALPNLPDLQAPAPAAT